MEFEILDLTPEEDQLFIDRLARDAHELEDFIRRQDPDLLDAFNRGVVAAAWKLAAQAYTVLHRTGYRIAE